MGARWSSLRCDDNVEGVDIAMELKEKDDLNVQVQIGCRALSSVSEGADIKISDDGEALSLTVENKEAEPVVKQECDLDWDMNKSGNVGLVEDRSKMSSLSCDDNIGGDDIEMEVKKKDYLNDKVQIGDRILRSMSKRAVSKISDDGEALNLTTENKEVEPVIQQPCYLDRDVSKSGNVGLAVTEIKRNSLTSDDYFEGLDIEMEVKKKNNSNDEVKIGGRVLRSMLKRVDNKIFHGGEINEMLAGKSRENEHDWFEKNKLMGEKEEGDDFVNSGYEEEGVHVKKDDSDRRELKRKRGRPPKLKMEEQDQCGRPPKGRENEHDWFEKNKLKGEKEEGDDFVSSGYEKAGVHVKKDDSDRRELKRKRGRPPKLKMEEQDQCGRPPKSRENEHDWFEKNELKGEKEEGDDFVSSGYEKAGIHLKKDSNDGRELKRKRGRPPKLKMEEQDQCGRPPKSRENEHDWFEKNKLKGEKEEGDDFVSSGYEKEGVYLKRDGNDRRELKRKRGRPPKLKTEEQDQLVCNVQRKRGRPPKMKMEEQDQLLVEKMPRKHGRPPKVGQKTNLLEVTHNRKGKVSFQKGKKGLTMRDGVNMNTVDDICLKKKRSCVQELKKKRFSPVKKSEFGNLLKTKNGALGSPVTSNSAKPRITKKKGMNKAKQVARQHILELLLAAGWTVDYRPRNRKDYIDAVYISPDGKTHWSITLAYKRLKKHSEAGDGEGEVYMPGFRFAPIPMEEFNILTKVMIKKRKSKSKSKLKQAGGKGEDLIDGIKRKVKKEQLGSFGGFNKSMKGKMKRNLSLVEEYNLEVTSLKRSPELVKDCKRQKTHNKKRSVLMVRNAEEIDTETNGYVLYTGKQTVLAWMIDLGIVLQNEKVHYVNQRRKGSKLEGRITGDGIHCDCCNEIVTISQFEAHAGSGLSDPLKNIHIERGISLLQCLLDSWNKQDEYVRKGFHFIDTTSEDPNDDACGICGDGGDLICCDSCPSTFHQSCLNIRKFPPGNWHCIYCCCKFCELVDGSINERDGYNDFTTSALLTCRLCDQKYHRACVGVNGVTADDSSFAFYCGNRCEELSKRLEMLLGVKHDIEDGLSWTFIHRSDAGYDASLIESRMVECNSKLAVALSVMDECFMPYIDHRSGINLIHSIIYNCGSNFNRLNYSGFITAILERGDEIICAASIRIRGYQLAEMPFVGTRFMYRKQGMCRRLLSAIELALSSLNVELLVIPAVSELRETWTSVFGFEPLEETRKQMIKNFNLLVFPHVDMLVKEMKKPKVADEGLIPIQVSNPELLKNQSTHEEATDCDEPVSFRSDLIISAGSGIPTLDICPINDRHVSVESGSPDGLLNNSHHVTSEIIHPDTSAKHVKCEVTCHAVNDNLTMEDQTPVNAHDYVSGAYSQADEISNLDCVQSPPAGLREINSEYITGCGSQQRPNGYCAPYEVNSETIKADESHVYAAKATNLQTLVHSGDCQSIHVTSGSCADIASGINTRSEAVSAAERNSDRNDKRWMNQYSDPPDLDLQVDETARTNVPLLCSSSNTASGMPVHRASADGTSCGGNTEVMVLSNGAS